MTKGLSPVTVFSKGLVRVIEGRTNKSECIDGVEAAIPTAAVVTREKVVSGDAAIPTSCGDKRGRNGLW